MLFTENNGARRTVWLLGPAATEGAGEERSNILPPEYITIARRQQEYVQITLLVWGKDGCRANESRGSRVEAPALG